MSQNEYLVTIEGKVARVCRHEADLVNFCILHAYDFAKYHLSIQVNPMIGDVVSLQTWDYLWQFSPYDLTWSIQSLSASSKKPFNNRYGSLVKYLIE